MHMQFSRRKVSARLEQSYQAGVIMAETRLICLTFNRISTQISEAYRELKKPKSKDRLESVLVKARTCRWKRSSTPTKKAIRRSTFQYYLLRETLGVSSLRKLCGQLMALKLLIRHELFAMLFIRLRC